MAETGKEGRREGERDWRNTKVRKSREQSAEPHTISFFRKRSLDICCTHYIKFRSAHKSMVKKRRMGEWGVKGGEMWVRWEYPHRYIWDKTKAMVEMFWGK